jgi:23S rRNA pseudouridine1911/1915/1917 synthase
MTTLLTVQQLNQPTRLDRVLRQHFPAWGRQAVQRLITAGQVQVNGRVVWLCSWEVKNQDRLAILATPPAQAAPPAQFADSWLIAQEGDLVVVNKPAGLLAEPTQWRDAANLRDLAITRFGPLLLFHRLDRDTSGVILLTRPGPINQYLDAAFKAHTVQKEYLAVVRAPNQLAHTGVIRARLAPHARRRDQMMVVERGGQHAITRYAIVGEAHDEQLIRLWPETGRTHQLRVHLAHIGAPIIGDRLYASSVAAGQRLLLHAQRLTLPAHAAYAQRTFTAPLPAEFTRFADYPLSAS